MSLIEGIESAQRQTYKDLIEGRVWSPEHLRIPHLPHTLQHMQRGKGVELDTPTSHNPLIPSNSLLDTPMLSIQRATDEFTEQHFSETGIYIEDMPIKIPGGRLHLPHNVWFGNFVRILDHFVTFEYTYNPHIRNQYLYLTIQQSWVATGHVQRVPGLHLDGFQKASIIPQVAQHQLAITNTIPTEFVAHAYETNLFPEDKHGLFKELTRQSDNVYRHKPLPFTAHMLNAFCPHAPGIAKEDQFRTFIRLSASVIPFMGDGNTRNPLLALSWNAEEKEKLYASIAA